MGEKMGESVAVPGMGWQRQSEVKGMTVTHQRHAFTWLLPLGQRGDEEEDRAGDEQAGDEQHREREQRLVHGLAAAQPVTRHAANPGTLLRGSLDVHLNRERN